MSWKLFGGAVILTVGLLLKVGAPLVPVLLGVAAAGWWNWTRQKPKNSGASKRLPPLVI